MGRRADDIRPPHRFFGRLCNDDVADVTQVPTSKFPGLFRRTPPDPNLLDRTDQRYGLRVPPRLLSIAQERERSRSVACKRARCDRAGGGCAKTSEATEIGRAHV